MLGLLGAPERRRLVGRRAIKAPPQPPPTPVCTGTATIVETGDPLADRSAAEAWIRQAGEENLDAGLWVLNRALRAHRLLTADPDVRQVGRSNLLVARIGYGDGEQVAEGLWSEARELKPSPERRSRIKVLQPQARLAAVLGGRERILVCEELLLRARLDLDEGNEREAALGLLVTLDAALAELTRERSSAPLVERLDELRAQRDPVATTAQAALAGALSDEERGVVSFVTDRIEAALRARAVARA